MLDPDVPSSVLQYLLHGEHDGEEELDLQKVSHVLKCLTIHVFTPDIICLCLLMFSFYLQIDEEQAELAQANFSILRKEVQAILDVVSILYVVIICLCFCFCHYTNFFFSNIHLQTTD